MHSSKSASNGRVDRLAAKARRELAAVQRAYAEADLKAKEAQRLEKLRAPDHYTAPEPEPEPESEPEPEAGWLPKCCASKPERERRPHKAREPTEPDKLREQSRNLTHHVGWLVAAHETVRRGGRMSGQELVEAGPRALQKKIWRRYSAADRWPEDCPDDQSGCGFAAEHLASCVDAALGRRQSFEAGETQSWLRLRTTVRLL